MNDWPPIWVLLATYKRTEVCLKTISSLGRYLVYPNLHFHICDDGSGETDDGTNRWHVGVLADKFSEFHPEVTWHEMDTSPGKYNTGGNINQGIGAAFRNGCSIYMLNFDDWALQRELDLRPMVDVLDSEPSVGFIRLSYTMPGMAGICVRYDCPRLDGARYMWLRLIRAWTLNNPWVVDRYMVSTQPYIAHVRFHEYYGWHPEDVPPGHSEIELGEQYNRVSHENGPQILFPIGPFHTHAPWGHIGLRANYYAEQFGMMHQ